MLTEAAYPVGSHVNRGVLFEVTGWRSHLFQRSRVFGARSIDQTLLSSSCAIARCASINADKTVFM